MKKIIAVVIAIVIIAAVIFGIRSSRLAEEDALMPKMNVTIHIEADDAPFPLKMKLKNERVSYTFLVTDETRLYELTPGTYTVESVKDYADIELIVDNKQFFAAEEGYVTLTMHRPDLLHISAAGVVRTNLMLAVMCLIGYVFAMRYAAEN